MGYIGFRLGILEYGACLHLPILTATLISVIISKGGPTLIHKLPSIHFPAAGEELNDVYTVAAYYLFTEAERPQRSDNNSG